MFGLLEKLIAEVFVLPALLSSAALKIHKYQLPLNSNSQPPPPSPPPQNDFRPFSQPMTNSCGSAQGGVKGESGAVGWWAGHQVQMWELPMTTTDERGGRWSCYLTSPLYIPFI